MKVYVRKGISLLEVLLVLVVGAVIITVAIRYFSSADLALDVTHAMNQIKKIDAASYRWLNMQKQENFSRLPNGKSISLQALIDAGLLANIKDNTLDPWGGTIIVRPGSRNSSYVQITLTDVPRAACINLKSRLSNIARYQMPGMCGNAKGLNVYVGEF